jgi:hypothetical protein
MVPYFADVLMASDFQSFQAMQSDSNVEDIRAMVRLLGPLRHNDAAFAMRLS